MSFLVLPRYGPVAMLLISCVAAQAAAHDFWVQPTAYSVSPASTIGVTLQVGHGPFRQRSPIPLSRITQFRAIAPNGNQIELHDRLHLGEPREDGDFQLTDPGSYVVVLQTDDRAQTHLPSIRFNDYLKSEGLTPALENRKRLNRMDADGSENYSRCAKALIQVGAYGTGSQAQITKPVGLPLEIVPEVSVYAIRRPSSLPVRVMYEGSPLPGALVKLTDLKMDGAPLEARVTDQEGRATFSMPSSGKWLLNVIWTKPRPPSEETDFETIFSSLSFGFDEPSFE